MHDNLFTFLPASERSTDAGPTRQSLRSLPGSTNALVSWTLRRAGDSARCVLRTIGDRVELHITMTDEVVMSQQCGGPEQAYAVSRSWWSALIDRGWIEEPSSVMLRPKDDRRCQRADEHGPLS